MKAKLIKAAMAIVMLLVILGLIYNNHQIKKELRQAQELAAADSTQYFKTKVNSLGQTVSTQDQTIATMDNAIALGLIRESELKANNLRLVTSNVRLTEQLTAAGLAGEYDKPPVIVYLPAENGRKTPCLTLPTSFGYHDTWLSIKTSIDTLGKAVYDSISVISKPSVWVGIEKTGLFKKDKPVVVYTNENPYFTTTAMTNVVISDKKKWYKTRGFALGVGALGGIIGTTLLLK